MTFSYLVFLPKATVLISVHPVHVSSKRSSWDWEAVGGALRKERSRGERGEERETEEEKEGRGSKEGGSGERGKEDVCV